jgi:protein involved in plasmid replication-relaxation
MTERKRRRRDTRLKNPKPISIQPRDIDIVDFVDKYRVVSQAQLQRLFFGSMTPARDRLESLFDHNFLERIFKPVFEGEGRAPTLYMLGKKGAELLRTERGYGERRWYSSSRDLRPDKIEHSLAINEVFLAIAFACRESGYEIRQWRTESEMKANYDHVVITNTGGKRERVAVIPDSQFVIVANGQKYPFLLELDRGTMPLRRFKNKIKAYVAYYESGKYTERYQTNSIRVITVVSKEVRNGGEGRMRDLKKTTEEESDKKWFWFTTLQKLTAETFFHAPIWYQSHNKVAQPLIEIG